MRSGIDHLSGSAVVKPEEPATPPSGVDLPRLRRPRQPRMPRRSESNPASVTAPSDEQTVAISRADVVILETAFRELRLELDIPPGAVRVSVLDGDIVLRGTLDWPYQNDAAVRCMQRLEGVKTVTSLIAVRASWKRLENAIGIHDAIRLLSEFDESQELANQAALNASRRSGLRLLP